MKAEYTLVNHNAWTVGIDTVTLAPRGKATHVIDLTEAQVELLNKQRVDVITVVNGVKRANAAIFTPDPKTSTVMLTPGSKGLVDAIRVQTPPPADPVQPVAPAQPTMDAPAPSAPAPEATATEAVEPTTDAPAVSETAKADRQAELLAMNGNSLKAMVKKDPYNFTGTDGLSKASIVEKILAFEFPTA